MKEMQHTFSSGEILYHQNIKELAEGTFTAEKLLYGDIVERMAFESLGHVNGRKAKVRFWLDDSSQEKVLFRKSLNILMQSDIFQAHWTEYQIEWLED